MILQHFFYSIIISSFLLSSCNNDTNKTTDKQIFDSNFRYSEKEFTSFSESIKNKRLNKTELIDMFKSSFDSTSSGDITVFKFVLKKYAEVIDTCWGLIQYKISSKRVTDNGIVCQ